MQDGPNAAAIAALDAPVLVPFWVGWLDFLHDPIRVHTAPYTATYAGTGDPDLDGHIFQAGNASVITVGPVTHKEDGSETVTVMLSGQIGPDTGVMDEIGDRANFQGRIARLWKGLMQPGTTNIIDVWPYYTGFMQVPRFVGNRESQTIALDIEGYYSMFSRAKGRTYLGQKDFDPGDDSATASIAIANGTSQLTGGGGGNGGAIGFTGIGGPLGGYVRGLLK